MVEFDDDVVGVEEVGVGDEVEKGSVGDLRPAIKTSGSSKET